MKQLHEISNKEWANLIIHISKKVLGNYAYPYPIGLSQYNDEVIESLRTVCSKPDIRKRKNRLDPIITIEFLPYFVVKWLQNNGFEINA